MPTKVVGFGTVYLHHGAVLNMFGKHVISCVWRVHEGRVGGVAFVVFDVHHQRAVKFRRNGRDSVADKMFGGINSKGTEDDEESEQGQGKPLMLGFLLEKPAPPISHASCWCVGPMKTLLEPPRNFPTGRFNHRAEI